MLKFRDSLLDTTPSSQAFEVVTECIVFQNHANFDGSYDSLFETTLERVGEWNDTSLTKHISRAVII